MLSRMQSSVGSNVGILKRGLSDCRALGQYRGDHILTCMFMSIPCAKYGTGDIGGFWSNECMCFFLSKSGDIFRRWALDSVRFGAMTVGG